MKNKLKGTGLIDLTEGMDFSIQKINEGISHYYPPVKANINCLTKAILLIKEELNKRYNNVVPYETMQQFDLVDYILKRFNYWVDNDELIGNMDARVFREGLEKQIEDMKLMLKHIDEEFTVSDE